DVIAGRLDDAEARTAEARELLAATENVAFLGALNDGLSLAIRGRVDEARAAASALTEGSTVGERRSLARFAQTILLHVELRTGHFDADLAAATADTDDDTAFTTERALPDLVEAAVRTGRRDLALATYATLS